MTNFQTKAEDRNQAKYQEKIATQLKAMMDGLKPLKKRKAGAVEGTYSKGDANEGKTVGGDGASGSSEMNADDVADAKAWLCWRFFFEIKEGPWWPLATGFLGFSPVAPVPGDGQRIGGYLERDLVETGLMAPLGLRMG